MQIKSVTDRLTVSAQPGAEDFAALAAKGVRRVINNRPDGEEANQLSAAEGARAAAAAGMDYVHIPVTMNSITDEAIGRFGAALADAPGPVHAHCRSGQRSITLWALSEVTAGRLSAAAAAEKVQVAGYDPKPVANWLETHHRAG